MAVIREFDVIIWGASGFTGRLVAEYYLTNYPDASEMKWAMAGRNESKLNQVRSSLGADHIPLIIAESHDRVSLDKMVARTKVICTTVGPYSKYGNELVASCIAQKTDYCDLAGEVQWMRRIIDKHHEDAKASGTRIVHTCGFDSVPSDMGVFFFQNEIKKRTGAYATHIKCRVKAMKGGMSGGTYASLENVMIEAEKDKSIFKVLGNPYGLNPKGSPKGLDKKDLSRVVFDKDINSWLAPFVMAMINTKVVRRSHALLGMPYGVDFRYDEAMMTGKGIAGRAKATAILAALGALMAGKPGSLWKKVVSKFLPDPGEGPSEKERENGYFNIALFGKTKEGSWVRGKVTGDRDPGYGSTSKMLGEAAVCLARDKDNCPDVSGILTPAVALAEPYLDRLQNKAGLSFEMI